MTRMTQPIRDALLSKLLRRAFAQRGNDLITRCADFAQRLYRDAMGPNLAQIDALPDGWLTTDNDIKVQLGADVKSVYFSGKLYNWALPETFRKSGITSEDEIWMRFPEKFKDRVVKQYPGDHALVTEFQKLDNEWNDLSLEISNAMRSAKAAMESVSTVKKLITIWPEVEEFAKEYLENGEQKAILPAIPREHLNNILNLPPENAA